MSQSLPPMLVKRTLATALAAGLLSSCSLMAPSEPPPPPRYASYSDGQPCGDRIGRCFDAYIGGKPIVAISDEGRHKAISARAQQANSNVGKVYWEVVEPVDGKLVFAIGAEPNELGRKHLGQVTEGADLTIYPLDGPLARHLDAGRPRAESSQEKPLPDLTSKAGRTEFAVAKTANALGLDGLSPKATVPDRPSYKSVPGVIHQGELLQDYLPPGRYVVEIRYQGLRNWDMKRVFLTVTAAAAPSGWPMN